MAHRKDRKINRLCIVLFSLVSFFSCQLICSLASFFAPSNAHAEVVDDTDFTSQGDGFHCTHHHHQSEQDNNHRHDHQSSSCCSQPCCVEPKSIALMQQSIIYPHKELLKFRLLTDAIPFLILSQYRITFIGDSYADPPHLTYHRNTLTSLSVAPNAPPTYL